MVPCGSGIWATSNSPAPEKRRSLPCQATPGPGRQAIWGPDSAHGREWAAERHVELDRGALKTLARALGTFAARAPEARRCIDYIARNRHRMRYPKFHHQGLCTSTGVLEAGCKVVVATWLKRAGVHWTLRDANAILALRYAKLSHRLADFRQARPALSPITLNSPFPIAKGSTLVGWLSMTPLAPTEGRTVR